MSYLAWSALLTLTLAGCRSNEAASEPDHDAYVMAFLVSGPSAAGMTPEERTTVQAAHMGNIGRLVDEGKMVIAGPFGHPSPDDSMRGIFVFDTGDLAEAREWTATDPAVQAGVLGMELSRLETATELREALPIYRRVLAEKGGAPEKVGMRGYAVVLARRPGPARAALGGLRTEGKIVFEGGLEGSQRGSYLAVLAAEDEKEAQALLEPVAAELGEHTVFPWWATTTLLELPAPAK